MLKVGVAGLRRGRGLANTFQNHPETRLAAICDPVEERREQEAAAFCVESAYADFDAFLEAGLDVVVVATPAPMHANHSIRAMEAGAHVLSEVPAAWSLDESSALADAVRRTGRIYMMAENMNFYHYVQDWKTKIQSGAIGRVFYAEAEYIHDCRKLMQGPGGERTWRASMPPIYYCTHSLGPVLDILDDRCVSAVGMSTGTHTEPQIGSIDMQVGLFRTAKGNVIKILCGFTVTREPGMHWQIFYGTEGTLENRRAPWEDAKIFRKGEGPMEKIQALDSDPDASVEARAGGHGTSEHFMVDRFVRAVNGQGPVPIDVYRSLDFSVPGLCAHLSAQQGSAPVDVPDYRVR